MVGLLSVRGIELVDLVYVYSVDVDRHVATHANEMAPTGWI